MSSLYTDFFVELHNQIQTQSRSQPGIDEPSLASNKSTPPLDINEVLAPIKTIEDYEMLVGIMESMSHLITARFLTMFFDALVTLEERVWANSAGKYPPIRNIYDRYSDCLLDNYREFVYNYERDLIDWTKKDGMFYDPKLYKFIQKRNDIYARYVVIADSVLNP